VTRTLVFEIGVEEVPSAPLYDAISQLETLAAKALKEARLEYATLDVFGSPRRLALVVTELAERQEDLSMRAKGPALKAAYDAEGDPTPAAAGFAKGKGVDVADLVRDTEGGGEYVFAVIDRPGRPAIDVLPAILSDLPARIEWVKAQRWGSGPTRFIRPVRWLLALFGDEVLPVTFAGLSAGRLTWGHRWLADNPVEVATAGDYPEALSRAKVVFDQAVRAKLVHDGVEAFGGERGGRAVVPEKTLAEVVNLVEWPTPGLGTFEESFLEVPREVLETAMTKHQRYFPVERPDGTLDSTFVVVHNGDPARTDAIMRGHERVIRARLADAAFFYREDLATPQEDRVARLDTIIFQEKLGTLAEKVRRVEKLAGALAEQTGATLAQREAAMRAAHLAKADLTSHVVVEFPTLQGVMGRYYALAAGEEPVVAQAVVDHYRPRFAGDDLPDGTVGMLVAAADKLDTIAGIFAIGAQPSGSSDPYALRRAAIGILAMDLDGGLGVLLDEAIPAAVAGYADILASQKQRAEADVVDAVTAFFTGRLEVMLRDRGEAYDIVAAVLAVRAGDPADAARRANALTAFRAAEAGGDLLVAFKRAANLADPSAGDLPDTALMGPEELALHEAVTATSTDVGGLVAQHRYDEALGTLAELRGPIDDFFDKVLVMDEDPAKRTNRLALLNRVVMLFEGFADLSKLEG
jgi:glycyl-tRNA synthetase beta chain